MRRFHKFLIVLIVLALVTAVYAAGNIKKTWGSATDIFATDGYSGAKADVNNAAIDYSTAVDLITDGYEGAHVTLEFDPIGSTDDLIVYVVSSVNGTDYDDDEFPLYTFTAENQAGADMQVSFVIKDVAYFKVGVTSTGGTDEHDVRIRQRRYRWYYE